ncbi:flavin reductase family protein [Caenimonas sp. DR4.4]|uniref:Flavin reductase family protein n=2 Tax=Caenimonas aquaedulcis TaxID=2793270 RepID=A0A931H8E2_9BURK|nr:flavin reductase family protein [Caenimonas aquaedulcis]
MSMTEDSRYKFLTGSVVPRPIALVTSLSEEGVLNAAPFSQYVIVSVTPPLLAFVAHDLPGGAKDTVRNVLATKTFVINSVTESMAEQVQQCSQLYPPSVSEVDEVGFTTVPSLHIRPARIAQSPLQFECRLERTVEFGGTGSRTTMIVGEVLAVHSAAGVVSGHRVDHSRLSPLGRIAGRAYCRTGEVIHV